MWYRVPVPGLKFDGAVDELSGGPLIRFGPLGVIVCMIKLARGGLKFDSMDRNGPCMSRGSIILWIFKGKRSHLVVAWMDPAV